MFILDCGLYYTEFDGILKSCVAIKISNMADSMSRLNGMGQFTKKETKL